MFGSVGVRDDKWLIKCLWPFRPKWCGCSHVPAACKTLTRARLAMQVKVCRGCEKPTQHGRSIGRMPWLSGMAVDVLVLVRITSGMNAASAQQPASTPAVNASTGQGSSGQELEC